MEGFIEKVGSTNRSKVVNGRRGEKRKVERGSIGGIVGIRKGKVVREWGD